jgi:hypothetical protein
MYESSLQLHPSFFSLSFFVAAAAQLAQRERWIEK